MIVLFKNCTIQIHIHTKSYKWLKRVPKVQFFQHASTFTDKTALYCSYFNPLRAGVAEAVEGWVRTKKVGVQDLFFKTSAPNIEH